MEDKQKIEELLENFRSLKSEIEIELNKEYPEYSLDSASFVKTGGGSNEVYSEVEEYVVDKYSLDEETLKKLQIVQIIKAAYESLSEKHKKIITDIYFEDKGLLDIASNSGWSTKTIRRKRDKILKKLKNVGILKGWEIWLEI